MGNSDNFIDRNNKISRGNSHTYIGVIDPNNNHSGLVAGKINKIATQKTRKHSTFASDNSTKSDQTLKVNNSISIIKKDTTTKATYNSLTSSTIID